MAVLVVAAAGCVDGPRLPAVCEDGATILTPVQSAAFDVVDGPPAVSGRLAFHSDRLGRNRVFTLDLPSASVTQLVGEPDHQSESPAWSPDGRQIVFSTTRFDPFRYRLAILQPSSGTVGPLTAPLASERQPRWSPDGRWIYFTSEAEGTQVVSRVAVTAETPTVPSTRLERRTDGRQRAFMPAPGRQVDAYVKGTPCGLRIVLSSADSQERLVGMADGKDSFDPAWSSSGVLTFVAQGADQAFLVHLEPETNRATATSLSGWPSVREPAWSPDGEWLAVAASTGVDAAADWDLVLVPALGSGPAIRATRGRGSDRAPAWQP